MVKRMLGGYCGVKMRENSRARAYFMFPTYRDASQDNPNPRVLAHST